MRWPRGRLCTGIVVLCTVSSAIARAQPPSDGGQEPESFDRWWGSAGAAVGFFARDSDGYYNLFFAFDYLLGYGLETAIELGLWYFDQRAGRDAVGGGFNLDAHWHFVHGPGWTLYLEGGVGVVVASAQVPRGALRFNFTPRAGLAFTWRPGQRPARFRGGVRWQHLSNASVRGRDDNPGFDALMLHAGVTFPL